MIKFNLITIFNDYWLNNEQKKNTFEILNKGLDNLSYDEYEYISELFLNPKCLMNLRNIITKETI